MEKELGKARAVKALQRKASTDEYLRNISERQEAIGKNLANISQLRASLV
jgi:hypothetical protein